MTGDDYDLMLNCTIGLLHSVNGALPDFEDGEKALSLLAPPGQPRYIFCIFFLLCIFCMFLFSFRPADTFARVAANLWILVLFHDSSWDQPLSSEDDAQICSHK
jgi:hypothetical protein